MRPARRDGITVLSNLLGLLLIVHLVNVFTGGSLLRYGIFPREPASLPFIFTAPLIHGSWPHLLNNALGLAVFSGFCLLKGFGFYVRVSLFIITLSGVLLWLFGRPAIHVGASAWIFGLWSLTIALAAFERSFLNILVAVIVVVLYGGMFYGMLPTDPMVSFEGHIFGALAGVVAAAIYARRGRGRRSK